MIGVPALSDTVTVTEDPVVLLSTIEKTQVVELATAVGDVGTAARA